MRNISIASAIAALFACTNAMAVTATLGRLNGNSATIIAISANAIGVDFDINNTEPATVNFSFASSESGSTLSFNSVVENLIGLNISQFSLALEGGASWQTIGSLTPTLGILGSIQGAGNIQTIVFSAPEPYLFSIGDISGTPGTADWRILLGQASSGGSTFSMTAQAATLSPVIPEPETYALVGLGLLGLGAVARRRRA